MTDYSVCLCECVLCACFEQQSNLIYSFECRQCERRYVGQTQLRCWRTNYTARTKAHFDSARESTEKRRGCPPKKRENPEDYPSAVACHLAANKECCLSYDDSDFRVLAGCRVKHHLNILEAMQIHVLKPVLSKQKLFVANLTLIKHAHSTNSHTHQSQRKLLPVVVLKAGMPSHDH